MIFRVITVSLSVLFTGLVHADQSAIEAFDLGNYKEAKQLFSAMKGSKETNNLKFYYLGRLAIIDGELDDAEDYLKDAISIPPNSADEHYWFGVVNGLQAADASIFTAGGYASDSKEHFEKAIKIDNKHIEAYNGLITFHLMAPSIVGGDKVSALALIKELSTFAPSDAAKAELNYLSFTEQHDALLSKVATYQVEFKSNPDILFSSAMALQRIQEYPKAHQILEPLSKLTPQSAEEKMLSLQALYQLARNALLGQIHLETGIDAMKRYLANKENDKTLPSLSWAKFRLSGLYELSNNTIETKRLLKELKSEKIEDKTLSKALKKQWKKYKI